MEFMKKMKNVLEDDFNYAQTENGALGYKTSGKALVDLNFAVSSLRTANNTEILDMFNKAYGENPELAIKWLFYARDVRNGLGERRLFRVIFKDNLIAFKHLLKYIPEYGRWDDILECFGIDDDIDIFICRIIVVQLISDVRNMQNNQSISLLAKWMPSENASSQHTKNLARKFMRLMDLTPKQYRQMLSSLRAYLKIVERNMCAKEWDKIDYEAVPSKANLIYKNAFLKNDELRRLEYLENLKQGNAKINSSVCYPHEIVTQYSQGSHFLSPNHLDTTLEEMWKSLPIIPTDGNTLVVRDGSGSMCYGILNNVSPLVIATSLAIYYAERAKGDFANKFITFSACPEIVDMSNLKTLYDKIRLVNTYNDCSNTNIEKTFDLILQTAISGRMKQEEIPKNILILSDMEFDKTCNANSQKRLFSNIAKKFKDAGYEMPRLIFWNLCSRTGTIPVKENKHGVALVSGFSINTLKMVMSNKLDPYEVLVEQLMSERYNPITLIK